MIPVTFSILDRVDTSIASVSFVYASRSSMSTTAADATLVVPSLRIAALVQPSRMVRSMSVFLHSPAFTSTTRRPAVSTSMCAPDVFPTPEDPRRSKSLGVLSAHSVRFRNHSRAAPHDCTLPTNSDLCMQSTLAASPTLDVVVTGGGGVAFLTATRRDEANGTLTRFARGCSETTVECGVDSCRTASRRTGCGVFACPPFKNTLQTSGRGIACPTKTWVLVQLHHNPMELLACGEDCLS